MKNVIFFLFQFLFFNGLFAQQGQLIIQKEAKGFYLEHKAAPKENFYSIGRLYNVHPRHLAKYNNLEMAKGLNLAQQIKIPLTDTNFSQNATQGVPVFYKTLAKEDLDKVASKFNLSLEQLNEWNYLSTPKISAGMKLMIGFLLTNEMTDRVLTVASTKNQRKEIEKAVPVVVSQQPVQEKVEVADRKTENKILEVTTINYFKKYFDEQIKLSPITKEETVTAGIFKTVTGWQNGKYYLLMNGVESGTILKITNPSNQKTVYAKVLYSMDGILQNQGLDIRISNAAAAVLEITETDKFILRVSY